MWLSSSPTLLRAGVEFEAAAVRDEKEERPCQSSPDSGWEGDDRDVDASLLGARSTSGLQKTQRLGSQRRVGAGRFPRVQELSA